jgi:hypothetical protein
MSPSFLVNLTIIISLMIPTCVSPAWNSSSSRIPLYCLAGISNEHARIQTHGLHIPNILLLATSPVQSNSIPFFSLQRWMPGSWSHRRKNPGVDTQGRLTRARFIWCKAIVHPQRKLRVGSLPKQCIDLLLSTLESWALFWVGLNDCAMNMQKIVEISKKQDSILSTRK